MTSRTGVVPRRIRLVHLVSTLNVGGLERVVLDLVRRLDRGRFDPWVVCLDEPGTLAPLFADIDVPVRAVGRSNDRILPTARATLATLRSLDPDIIHTHNPSPHLHGALAHLLLRRAVLVNTKHGRNEAHQRVANRVSSFLSDCIIAVSEDAARVAIELEHVSPGRVRVIHNGIDPSEFAIRDSRPAGARVVHVARLNPVKDQLTLIRAARIVADARSDFHLDIIGDGPYRAPLEASVRELALSDRVTFQGYRADIPAALARADLFVLSSISEGMSLTLLEAMAAGLPAVATRVGGNPEVIAEGETGLLVPPGSPQPLADAMIEILGDPVRSRAMGLAARQRVTREFNVSDTAKRYELLYRELLGLRPEASLDAA